MSKLECVEGNGKKYATEIPYSTTERRVGTWTNGKPLYEKVITGTTGNTTDGNFATKEVPMGTSNLDDFFIDKAFCYDSYGESLPIPYTSNTGYIIKALPTKANTLRVIINGSVFNNLPFNISIRYTKTTD